MKIKIPYGLKMKFLTHEGLSITKAHSTLSLNGYLIKIPSSEEIKVELDLSEEAEYFKICTEWIKMIQYEGYKIDIGEYVGLWPIQIDSNSLVTFSIDQIDQKRKNWEDWFIIEGDENASK